MVINLVVTVSRSSRIYIVTATNLPTGTHTHIAYNQVICIGRRSPTIIKFNTITWSCLEQNRLVVLKYEHFFV